VTTWNLNTIEKYIKNVNTIDSNKVIAPRLPQSKSYLKILGIPYLIEDINLPITTNIVEKVTYIFNDIVLASWSYIIKAFSKLDMAVIWVDI